MRSVVGTVATAVAVLVSTAVLLVGALAWRLSSGPIELPSLTSRLQTALSSPRRLRRRPDRLDGARVGSGAP